MLKLNEIYNIDCVEGLKQLDSMSIDMVITSPPYADLRTYNGFEWDFQSVASELYRVIKKGGTVVWIVGDKIIDGDEQCIPFEQALYFRNCGFNLLDTMIWNKGSFAFPSKYTYHQVFEYMFIFTKGKPKTLNFLNDRRVKYIGERGASGRKTNGERNHGKSSVINEYGRRFNIWDISVGGGISATDKFAFQHPAIFPETLVRDHILTWSNPNDIILDPFIGSGTTAKVCIETDRNYIGFDISKEYCDLANQRIGKDITKLW